MSQALSPDGKWVLSVPLGRPGKLVMLPTGAGEARTLSYPIAFAILRASWFPDGRRLLIYARQADQGERLFVQDGEGAELRPLTPEGTSIFSGAISPDGRFVTAIGPDEQTRNYPVEGGEPRPIPGLDTADVVLRWSAGGQALFVMRPNELPARIERLDLRTGEKKLWRELMPADGAGILDIGPVLLSEDGTSYVYSFRRFLSTLYLAEGLR
ncbi:MAG: TolB family protein [Candidatus Krumholzibacteriia bacterium]